MGILPSELSPRFNFAQDEKAPTLLLGKLFKAAPLAVLPKRAALLPVESNIVVFCQGRGLK